MGRFSLQLACIIACLGCACFLAGCGASHESASVASSSSSSQSADAESESEQAPDRPATSESSHEASSHRSSHSTHARQVEAVLNGQSFTIELEDNQTADAFYKLLPLRVEMSELNSNEKYVYLDSDLPSSPVNPGTVEVGDVMLFQGNCLVIFYQAHQTSYSYTPIGKIVDAAALASTLGGGAISANFQAM